MTSVLTDDDVTHGVWNGDCLKLLPALPEASVDREARQAKKGYGLILTLSHHGSGEPEKKMKMKPQLDFQISSPERPTTAH